TAGSSSPPTVPRKESPARTSICGGSRRRVEAGARRGAFLPPSTVRRRGSAGWARGAERAYLRRPGPGGKEGSHPSRARASGDGFAEPENLGDAVNSVGSEVSPAISPDERTLVFVGLGRDDEQVGIHRQYAHGDLYVSHREADAWSPARNAGPAVNSGA